MICYCVLPFRLLINAKFVHINSCYETILKLLWCHKKNIFNCTCLWPAGGNSLCSGQRVYQYSGKLKTLNETKCVSVCVW